MHGGAAEVVAENRGAHIRLRLPLAPALRTDLHAAAAEAAR
jgi:hypothetical protein